MENIKKNPVYMGILGAVGGGALLFVIEFVLSLIKKRSLGEQLSDPINVIILVVGTISTGVSSYMKAKKASEEKKEQ